MQTIQTIRTIRRTALPTRVLNGPAYFFFLFMNITIDAGQVLKRKKKTKDGNVPQNESHHESLKGLRNENENENKSTNEDLKGPLNKEIRFCEECKRRTHHLVVFSSPWEYADSKFASLAGKEIERKGEVKRTMAFRCIKCNTQSKVDILSWLPFRLKCNQCHQTSLYPQTEMSFIKPEQYDQSRLDDFKMGIRRQE